MCFGRLMLSRIACARVTRGKGDNYSENKSIQLQIMSLRILNLSAKYFRRLPAETD